MACRRKGAPETFFRMVAAPDGQVVAELGSRLPGRGAHCCFRIECLEKALRGGALQRALRRMLARPDAQALIRSVQALLAQALGGMLTAAERKRVLAAGREAAWQAMPQAPGGRVFLAADVGADARREAATKDPQARALPFTKEELGRLLGRPPVGVLFVGDASLADGAVLRSDQASALAGARQ